MSKPNAWEKTVNDYLYFGYLPPSSIPEWVYSLQVEKVHTYSVQTAISVLDSIFDESIKNSSQNGYCIIPISGGWDSRILLGLALERFNTSQIKTYTFGRKGQLDYDIGIHIAKKAGVEHIKADLGKVELDWGELENSVLESPWTYVPDAFFNKHCYKHVAGENDIILSGFMGDPLTGGHFHEDTPEALNEFVREQSVLRSGGITAEGYDPLASLPEIPSDTELTIFDIADFGIRQAYCIAPIISSKKNWNSWGTNLGSIKNVGAELVTPFTHPEWAHYWLHAPEELKFERKLYLGVLQKKFPKLAALPSKNFYGAKTPDGIDYYIRKKIYHGQIVLNQKMPQLFSKPNQMINYLDYSSAFRNREDYRGVLSTAFSFLKEYKITPWIDLSALLKQHDSFEKDHSKAFLLLIGLVLNMKVNRKTVGE